MNKSDAVLVRVDPALLRQASQSARAEKVSRSEWIRRAMRDRVEAAA